MRCEDRTGKLKALIQGGLGVIDKRDGHLCLLSSNQCDSKALLKY